ncbi:MAG TPA: SDR family NAD(P)-dependent oxidoreductase [Chiayiivirga sp.]|nr:SDR family NAD(P)-dependent oxidoreductase [Chiayiivirga sp.]
MPSSTPGDKTKQPLADRTILVVGAHGGFGEALVRACARAGAQVVLLGRRIPRLNKLYDALESDGAREPAIYPLDLSGATPDDYAVLASTLERECGRLDGIVHCATEFKGLASLENMPLDDWFTGLHVNLTAPWLLTRACLPLLRQREDASVVFLLDDPAHVSSAFWGSYGVSTHALLGLIAILREELSNSTVRVQGAQPGPMRTALRGRAYFAEDPGSVPMPDAYVKACISLLAGAPDASNAAIVKLHAERANAPRPLGLSTHPN